jgi:hypothetical protein
MAGHLGHFVAALWADFGMGALIGKRETLVCRRV